MLPMTPRRALGAYDRFARELALVEAAMMDPAKQEASLEALAGIQEQLDQLRAAVWGEYGAKGNDKDPNVTLPGGPRATPLQFRLFAVARQRTIAALARLGIGGDR